MNSTGLWKVFENSFYRAVKPNKTSQYLDFNDFLEVLVAKRCNTEYDGSKSEKDTLFTALQVALVDKFAWSPSLNTPIEIIEDRDLII